MRSNFKTFPVGRVDGERRAADALFSLLA
jgi:hypothetical protein